MYHYINKINSPILPTILFNRLYKLLCFSENYSNIIILTRPCKLGPIASHFYFGKNRVYHVYSGIRHFLIFVLKHRLWVLFQTASIRR